MCEKCGYEHNEKNARSVWLKSGFGRLYWKKHHPKWRYWQREDMAMAIDRPVRMFFYSTESIIHTALGLE